MRKTRPEAAGQPGTSGRRRTPARSENHHLRLSEVSKYFPGNPRPALRSVSLALPRGAVLALLGESGSGKTTLLRLVAGFEQPSGGAITLAGALIGSPRHATPPEERGVGMVFQDTALLPHLTILQNVAFGLRRLPEPVRRSRAERTLELVRATEVRDRYPHEVSGGQAQRAAIGRALAPQPALLLFDEPFNNLDRVLKGELLHELRTVLRETAATALFVTHDRDEAFTVADGIAVLHRGRIAQVGAAETLYAAPASAFVARYLGAVNLVPVWREGSAWVSALGPVAGAEPFRYAGVETVSVRPWQLQVHAVDQATADHDTTDPRRANHDAGTAFLCGTVRGQRFMGEYREVRVQVDAAPGSAGLGDLTAHVPAPRRFRTGDRVKVALPAADAVR